MLAFYKKSLFAAIHSSFLSGLWSSALSAQSGGSSTSVTGTVVDPTGAVVPNATVEIHNPVSGFERTATTDSAGKFTIPNIPFNPYHLTVTGPGLCSLRAGRRCSIDRSRERQHHPAGKRLVGNGDGRGGGRRSAGERSHLSHRCGPRPVRQAAAGKPVVLGEFAGHARLRRELPPIPTVCSTAWAITRKTHFPWTASPSPTSRARSSPTRFRSIRFESMEVIAGAPPAEYRRQDQRGDQRDHALGPGRDHAARAA